MSQAKREISGFFLSADKFASHVAALAQPDCTSTHLRLFHNEPHHTAAVLHALSTNASVTSLDLFELDSAAATTLGTLLATTSRLTSLAVHHVHSHEAVSRLAQGIGQNRTLSHLHFSQLDARGVEAIAAALNAWAAPIPPASTPAAADAAAGESSGGGSGGAKVNSDATARLQQLRLEKCIITAVPAAALAAALGPQAATFEQLEIVESEFGDAAAEALLAAPGWRILAAAPHFVGLNLSSCQLGPRGAALLGDFLRSTRSLQALDLSNNRALGCIGAGAIASGLANNHTLRRLDLSGCGVGTAGTEALARALGGSDCATEEEGGADAEGQTHGSMKLQPSLDHLVLSSNAAGAAGLRALLRALSGPQPCALRTLILNHSHIHGEELVQGQLPASAAAATAAADAGTTALPVVTAPLEQLSLAANALYDAGVAALATCLAEAPFLEHLDLRENGISDAGVGALLPLITGGARPAGSTRNASSGGACPAAASAPRGLQGLLLDGNRLHNVGAQVLLDAVTAAPGLWRFSAEANKLTDPALRLSLSQLSQLRAARHSQLVVLGRQYSSSSSENGEDSNGRRRSGSDGANRGSGGGGGDADGGDSRRSSHGGRGSGGGAGPMETDGPRDKPGGGGTGVNDVPRSTRGDSVHHHRHHQHNKEHLQQQQTVQHKHRLDETEACNDGGSSSGDEHQRARNVAARNSGLGADEQRHGRFRSGQPITNGTSDDATMVDVEGDARGGGCGEGAKAWSGFGPATAQGAACSPGVTAGWASHEDRAQPCMPSAFGESRAGAADVCWRPSSRLPSAGGAADRRSAGGSTHTSSTCGEVRGMMDTDSGAAGLASPLSSSPPLAFCFVTAVPGSNGAGAAGVVKHAVNVGNGGSHAGSNNCGRTTAGCSSGSGGLTPQQYLPACRRPRYKPLTPEQQRLFEDF